MVASASMTFMSTVRLIPRTEPSHNTKLMTLVCRLLKPRLHRLSPPLGSWAAPGRYTVRLTVNGQAHSAPLDLRMDLAGDGGGPDLRADLALLDGPPADATNVTPW